MVTAQAATAARAQELKALTEQAAKRLTAGSGARKILRVDLRGAVVVQSPIAAETLPDLAEED